MSSTRLLHSGVPAVPRRTPWDVLQPIGVAARTSLRAAARVLQLLAGSLTLVALAGLVAAAVGEPEATIRVGDPAWVVRFGPGAQALVWGGALLVSFTVWRRLRRRSAPVEPGGAPAVVVSPVDREPRVVLAPRAGATPSGPAATERGCAPLAVRCSWRGFVAWFAESPGDRGLALLGLALGVIGILLSL